MKFSIYELKPKFQKLLSPLISTLMLLHITPNQITVFAMVLSLLYGATLTFFPTTLWLWMLYPFFMLLRMALNAIDGMLANTSKKKTALGTLLNEICDQISDAALTLPFALLASIYAPLLVVVVVTAMLAEFAGVTAVLIGASRRFDGPMGKSDRAFVFSVIAILALINASPMWLNGILCAVLLLLLLTIINRLFHALQQPKNTEPPIL